MLSQVDFIVQFLVLISSLKELATLKFVLSCGMTERRLSFLPLQPRMHNWQMFITLPNSPHHLLLLSYVSISSGRG
jgi:hypothetical protein